jgi:hypothetical protein
VLHGCYTAQVCNWLPAFQENVSVPSAKVSLSCSLHRLHPTRAKASSTSRRNPEISHRPAFYIVDSNIKRNSLLLSTATLLIFVACFASKVIQAKWLECYVRCEQNCERTALLTLHVVHCVSCSQPSSPSYKASLNNLPVNCLAPKNHGRTVGTLH